MGEVKMRIYWEVLPGGAGEVLELLAGQPWASDFYLAGGTGLALQLGHRISMDLDLSLAVDPLGFGSRSRVVTALESVSRKGRFTVDQEEDGTLRVSIHGIGVALFHYNYLLVGSPVPILGNLKIPSLEDIGLMKVAAIIGRGRKRDFLDLYFISPRISLEQFLEFGSAKYAQAHDFGVQALRVLVYFEDAEEEQMPRMLKEVSWEAVKTHFEQEAIRLSRGW
ncbi:MAG TPA: hypothetical protein EYP53_02150, partial [Candidatus Latescibacteria bacterium]|nr:hypothetical protein [Candidatus Latescibacterota bacterium]